jgi:hypothetical protein
VIREQDRRKVAAIPSTGIDYFSRARLDQSYYPKGKKVTDKQLAGLPIERHDFHGEWNYTLTGRAPR